MAMKKFNGSGSVVVRSIGETTLNGVVYQENDIIAKFEEVDVMLTYESLEKESKTDAVKLGYNKYNPYSFHLNNVRNTEELNTLHYIVKSKGVLSETLKIQNEMEPSSFGKILLKVPTGSVLKVETFSDGKRIYPEVNLDDGYIVLDKKYNKVKNYIFYEQISDEFMIEKPQFGYVRITAFIEGKLGEKRGTFSLDIPTANLVTDPSFDLSENTYGANLTFSVIENGKKPVVRFFE